MFTAIFVNSLAVPLMISWVGFGRISTFVWSFHVGGEREVSVCSSREFKLCLREITRSSPAPNSGHISSYSVLHLIQFLSSRSIFFLDRPSSIQYLKIWIVSKKSRSNKKNYLSYRKHVDPISKKNYWLEKKSIQ